MKTKMNVLAIITTLILFTSCRKEFGSGTIVTEVRTVENFTKINLLNSADVEIIKGDTLKVEVSDYENIVEYLSVETKNNTLEIETKPLHTMLSNSKAKVIITIPDVITSVEISGSGNIICIGDFGKLESLKISGSGNIIGTGTNTMSNVALQISGSGNIELSGSALNTDAEISGSGNIDCANLQTQTATCDVNGSGDFTIDVVKTLHANISGSGNISYYGNPSIVRNITGSGEIKKR